MDEIKADDDILYIQRVLSGDSAAYAFLVKRHSSNLQNFCALKLGSWEDAEDAVQDVFIRAYRALPRFRLGSSFRAWLFGIASNRLKTRYAARSRERNLLALSQAEFNLKSPEGRGGDVELEALRALELSALRRGMSGLDGLNRRVLELYYGAGLDLGEISQATGLKMEALKSRLFRSRKKLMEILLPGATDGKDEG